MGYDPDIHHRRSIRLKYYDYSSCGAYFVTICGHGRECLLGEIADGGMRLNEAGRMVEGIWRGLPERFPCFLDKYVLMPNHFHAIVLIRDSPVGAGSPRPIFEFSKTVQGKAKIQNQDGEIPATENQGGETPENQGGETPPLRKRTLGQIIGYFKYQATKEINTLRGTPGVPVWQRNYHERVIRNENELNAIREYIANNPKQWESDKENPVNVP